MMSLARWFLAVALSCGLAFPAVADGSISIRVNGEAEQHERVSVKVRSLYGSQELAGTRTPDEAWTTHSFELTEAAWIGGFARLEVLVTGIQLPDGDANAGRDVDVSFEVALLDTDRSADMEIEFPLISSTMRSAREAYLERGARQGDELRDGFFRLLQFLEVFRVDSSDRLNSEFGAAARRLVKSAADYSLDLSKAVEHREWPEFARVLIIPPESVGKKIDFYLAADSAVADLHRDAYLDARIKLWMFPVAIPEILQRQDRQAACRHASAIVEHAMNAGQTWGMLASTDENRLLRNKLLKLYSIPGTFEGYVKARAIDIQGKCRPR